MKYAKFKYTFPYWFAGIFSTSCFHDSFRRGGLRGLGEWGNKLVDFGKYGVISFFVLSALTLSMSIDRTSKFSYKHYLSRRFARILPVYCILILLFWFLGGADSYQKMFEVKPHDFFDLLSHLTFMKLWIVGYQNTIIGVEWTVPIEMWMYLLIPPLFFFLRRHKRRMGWSVLFVATVISIENQHLYWGDFITLRSHWAIETYLYCFVAGIVAYGYFKETYLSEKMADISVAAVIVMIGVLCINGDYLNAHWQAYLVSLSPRMVYAGGSDFIEESLTLLVMALVLALSQARYTRPLFENRPITFLGNISFPFYLLHIPILYFFSNRQLADWQIFVAALLTTSAIAYFCHTLIEKPALKITGKLHPYDP